MVKILPLLLLMSACAVPTYTTKHGLKVYDHTTETTPTLSEVERVVDYVIRYVPNVKRLDGYKVILFNKWIQVPNYEDDGYKLADGLTNPIDRVMLISVFQTCFADSSFPHELAHALHDADIPDWWHEDKEFWKSVKRLEKRIVEDLCPEGFVHKDIPPDYVPKK